MFSKIKMRVGGLEIPGERIKVLHIEPGAKACYVEFDNRLAARLEFNIYDLDKIKIIKKKEQKSCKE